jgi:hypothetical protein
MKNHKVLFCGDFSPNTNSDEYEANNAFLSSIKNYVSEHNQAFVNLEGPFTDSSKIITKNGPNLKICNHFIDPLVSAGFNLFGLANNHIMDYGKTGLQDTIELLNSKNLSYVGAGYDLREAQRIHFHEHDGITIAIIALAEKEFSIAGSSSPGVAPLDVCQNYYQIQKAKQLADIVIVTMHAGNEHFPFPRPNLRSLCHLYIDMGVDLIVNHHTHVPSAYEVYKDKKIYYGLGNFIFNMPDQIKSWYEGYMLSIDIKKGINSEVLLLSEIIPYEQNIGGKEINILKGSKKAEFLNRIEGLRASIEDSTYLREWDDFCESKKNQYFLATFFPYSFKGVGLLERLFSISKLLLNKKTIPVKLNMLECDSHLDVLINILKREK